MEANNTIQTVFDKRLYILVGIKQTLKMLDDCCILENRLTKQEVHFDDITEDLFIVGMDSLDVVEFCMELEKTFEILIPDEEFDTTYDIATNTFYVKNLIDFLEPKITNIK